MESLDEIQETAEDYTELKKAIQGYKQALNKCKNATRLGNYHKKYQKYLHKRCDQVKETQLSRIQHLIQPGLGTDYSFNIYKFLVLKLKKQSVSLPIIETLILNDSEIYHLKNSKEGDVVINDRENSTKNFMDSLQYIDDGIPVCVAKPDNGRLLLFDSAENLTKYLSQNSFRGILQKYVNCGFEHLSILRIHWQGSGKIRGFLITNYENSETEVGKIDKVRAFRKSFGTLNDFQGDHLYKNDEEYLNYAFNVVKKQKRAQLKRFSFIGDQTNLKEMGQKDLYSIIENEENTETIEKNSFLEELSCKCKEYNIHLWKNESNEGMHLDEKELKKYILSGTDPEELRVIELKNIYQTVLQSTLKIVEITNTHLYKHKKSLKEITLDFIKDSMNWVLLKADNISLIESFNNFKEVPSPFNKLNINSFIPPLTHGGKKIDIISLKIKNIPSKRVESPILHKRTMSPICKIPVRYPSVKGEVQGSISVVKEKLENLITRTETLAFPKIKLEESNKVIIKNYSEAFQPFYDSKKSDSKKSVVPSDITRSYFKDKIEYNKSSYSNSGFHFRPVIKEYNAMMIHVRRVNLRKKRPLIESYGGEEFFHNLVKVFFQRGVSIESVNKKISTISRESFHGMFLKGLGCVFNSDISLEFRQMVRQKHKSLNIELETFRSFCYVFTCVLQEFKVLQSDIEIIYDNLMSFSSAICQQSKSQLIKG